MRATPVVGTYTEQQPGTSASSPDGHPKYYGGDPAATEAAAQAMAAERAAKGAAQPHARNGRKSSAVAPSGCAS